MVTSSRLGADCRSNHKTSEYRTKCHPSEFLSVLEWHRTVSMTCTPMLWKVNTTLIKYVHRYVYTCSTCPMLHVADSTWLAVNLRGNCNLVDSFVKQSNVCMQVMTCTMASSCIHPKIQQQLSHSKTSTMCVVWRHSLDKIKGLQTTQP